MTHPLVDGLSIMRNPAAATQLASQDVSLRRSDEVARVLRRANDVKAQATDKVSAQETRGLTPRTQELSRGSALLQAAEQGLDTISNSLRRMVVLIDQASTSAVSREEIAKLQQQLDTVRMDVFRVAQQSAGTAWKQFGGGLGGLKLAFRDDGQSPTAGLSSESLIAGLRGIDLNDTVNLAEARRNVDATLNMVMAARSDFARLSEKFAEEISTDGAEDVFMVGASSLGALRYQSAARASEVALGLRDLFMRDFRAGFAAQANSSSADALRALGE